MRQDHYHLHFTARKEGTEGMGTLFHSVVGKVKSSAPAGKSMKNIPVKRGHVQNKNKAPEVN